MCGIPVNGPGCTQIAPNARTTFNTAIQVLQPPSDSFNMITLVEPWNKFRTYTIDIPYEFRLSTTQCDTFVIPGFSQLAFRNNINAFMVITRVDSLSETIHVDVVVHLFHHWDKSGISLFYGCQSVNNYVKHWIVPTNMSIGGIASEFFLTGRKHTYSKTFEFESYRVLSCDNPHVYYTLTAWERLSSDFNVSVTLMNVNSTSVTFDFIEDNWSPMTATVEHLAPLFIGVAFVAICETIPNTIASNDRDILSLADRWL